MLSLAITSWWCELALIFLVLQPLALLPNILVLILLAINLVFLLVSVMLFCLFKKQLQFNDTT